MVSTYNSVRMYVDTLRFAHFFVITNNYYCASLLLYDVLNRSCKNSFALILYWSHYEQEYLH
jgi:hypothetical protein